LAILAGRLAAYGLAAAAVVILANTAVSECQARDSGPGSAAAGAQVRSSAAPVVSAPGTAPPGTASPAAPSSPGARPRQPVPAGQLRVLAGKWLSSAQAKDYFIFKADGRGAWMVRGRPLWQGRVTPASRDAFRLLWPTTGPQRTAYWQVKLIDGGRRLVFDGTRQTYRKV
jgi:hypothetical protein